MRLPFPTLKDFLKFIYPAVSFPTSLLHLPSPRFKRALFAAGSLFSLLFIFLYFYLLRGLPSPYSLTQTPLPLTTHIRDRQGRTLYKIYSGQNRTLVRLSDLPPHVPQAILAIEDKDFYRHDGFSPRGILRAAWHLLTRRRLEGGSTITQQLVKTTLLTPQRTLARKLKELILAATVETKFTKPQILEMYLNRVAFGGTAFGIEEAAQTYFGIPAKDLSLAQAALLAGLPAAPTAYSPFGPNPQLAKSRQKDVLTQMAASGFITWDQAQDASARELSFRSPAADIQAPHFVMYVKDLLSQKYGPQVIEQSGLDVTTSLDLDIQNNAQQTLSREIAKIGYLHVTNGAALITRPGTGEILAMVGSRDFFDIDSGGQVNVTLRPRQPGSSIKPLTYALALSRGFTAATLIDDSPVTFRFPDLPSYSPANYDRRYHGPVTLRTALGSSYNVPAVKLLAAIGTSHLVDLGRDLGISTWTDSSRYGLSLTLGAGEVTMADMAVAYGTFANLGRRVDLSPILKVTDSTGRILEDNSQLTKSNPQPVLDQNIAFIISDILSDNSARTPAFGSNSRLYIPSSPVAVKTGTTDNLRDNWTIGYTSDFLVAVWVGNNDNSPMSYVASGTTGASPVWRRLTDLMLETYPYQAPSLPSGLARLPTCAGRLEYFLPGTAPAPCPTPSVSPPPPIDRLLTGSSTENPAPALPPENSKKLRPPRPRR